MPDCDPITYFFTAVAFDQCLNASLVTAASQSQGTQCGDCAFPDLCYNAPPAPTTLTPGGCSSVDGLRVTWDELDTNITATSRATTSGAARAQPAPAAGPN